VGDVEAGLQRLGSADDEPVEGLLVPMGVPAVGRLLLDQLLLPARIGGDLLLGPPVLDPVGRGLYPYVALVVEAPSARPPGDLLELPVGEEPGGRAVVLAELGNSTVRIGTLMPTPSVSVPQIILSRPAWANFSMSRR